MATVSELKIKAKEMGLKGYSKMKKAELEKLVMGSGAKSASPVKSASPAKKSPPATSKPTPKKAPARPKKQTGYTIKEVKNSSELKEVVKQYIRNWVSRPAQQKAYNNKIKNTTTFTEAEIKRIDINAIKGSGSFMIRGTALSKADNFDARQNAFDIKFELNTIGKKAPYKIEPLFDNTTMTIYTDGHSDAEYPVFVEFANAGNKDLDRQSVEKAEKSGLSEGISFAREGDEEAFAAKRESTQAFRKQRAKENRKSAPKAISPVKSASPVKAETPKKGIPEHIRRMLAVTEEKLAKDKKKIPWDKVVRKKFDGSLLIGMDISLLERILRVEEDNENISIDDKLYRKDFDRISRNLKKEFLKKNGNSSAEKTPSDWKKAWTKFILEEDKKAKKAYQKKF